MTAVIRFPQLQSAAPRTETATARRRLVVLGLVLTAQLMVVLDATIVNIALPDISSALHFTPTSLSWVINAYTLVFGGLLLLGARAGDILGRRRVFLSGIAVFTVASLLGGFASSGGLLLAARSLQGVGAALAAPSALALLMTMFPDARERVRAIGYYTAVSIGGSAVGLIAGGMLTQWASWRWVLFVNVPIGLAVIAVAARVLPETERKKGHFDLPGAITSTLGMTGLVYGFVRAASSSWGDPITIAAFVLGALLLATFIAVEARAQSPIIPLGLFADRDRATSYLARLLLVAGMMGMFFFLTQFLQDVLGYSSLATGFAFLPMPVTVFAVSQLTSRVLVHRVNGKLLMVLGMCLAFTGFALASRLVPDSSYLSVVASLLFFGMGNGLAFVPLTATSLRNVAPADSGAASGLVNVMQQVGGALGLAVLVTVFGSASRAAVSPASASALEKAQHAFVVGADRGFLVAACFLAATVVLVLVAIRPQPKPTADLAPAIGLDEEAADLRAPVNHA